MSACRVVWIANCLSDRTAWTRKVVSSEVCAKSGEVEEEETGVYPMNRNSDYSCHRANTLYLHCDDHPLSSHLAIAPQPAVNHVDPVHRPTLALRRHDQTKARRLPLTHLPPSPHSRAVHSYAARTAGATPAPNSPAMRRRRSQRTGKTASRRGSTDSGRWSCARCTPGSSRP